MDSTRLGQLARSYELLEEEELERCLELQATVAPPRHLGEILIEEKVLSPETLKRLLSAQRKEIERQGSGPRLETTQIAERVGPGAGLRPFLEILEEAKGEELHLAAGSRPAIRVHGALQSLRPEPLSTEEATRLIGEFIEREEDAQAFASERSARLIYAPADLGRYRVNLLTQSRGPGAVVCRIVTDLPKLEVLGLPAPVKEVARLRSGLVLVTGPRASGKSTTLAAMIELINDRRRAHVVCLEETVEFVHESRHSLVTQIEVEPSGWDQALHAALRLDPDVIVVGDLDSPSRLATALRGAETGHLVLGTLSTARAEQTLLALIRGCGLDRRDQVCSSLAELLRLVICQQLIPDLEGERLVLATEVLRNTPAIANMIREQRFHQLTNVMQTSRELGMSTLDDGLFRLVITRQISAGDALARAGDPERLFLRLQTQGGKTQ
jgi:twitching motility protein PilT